MYVCIVVCMLRYRIFAAADNTRYVMPDATQPSDDRSNSDELSIHSAGDGQTESTMTHTLVTNSTESWAPSSTLTFGATATCGAGSRHAAGSSIFVFLHRKPP